MADPVRMTNDDRIVLDALGLDSYYCFSFSAIPLPRSRARAACRRLAQLGLARFERGLVTDDGELAGSGYGITDRGVHMMRGIHAMREPAWCKCSSPWAHTAYGATEKRTGLR